MPKTKQKINVQKLLVQATGMLRKGTLIEAEIAFQTVLDRFPKNQRAAEGLRAVRQKQARALRPELNQNLIERMFAMRAQGRLDEALAEARLLSSAYPDQPVLFNFLATCLFETDKYHEALEAVHKALALKKAFPEAHLNQSIVLHKLGQTDAALDSCKLALHLRANYPAALLHMALLDEAKQNWSAAIAGLEKVLDLEPKSTPAHNNLGNIYKFLGDFESAIKHFEITVKHAPEFAEFHCNLAELKSYVSGDPHILQMQELLDSGKLSTRDAFPLCFALAKALEDVGEFDQSFERVTQGNRIRKQEHPYDVAEFTNRVATLKQINPDKLPVSHNDALQGRPTPVFIVGPPRSGTSLVEQILASHSKVFGAGELNDVNAFFENTIARQGTDASLDADLNACRVSYMATISELAKGHDFCTDKLPVNFQWIGYIIAMFPNAKIIHVQRDPVAVCWSMLKRRFSSTGNGFAYDIDDLVAYYAGYRDLMRFWNERYPENILNFSYEELTTNQEKETQHLLSFLGLEWEDQCLDFQNARRAVRTASTMQVRKKMYTGSSDDWRRFEKHLQPLITGLAELD